ncbi:MAG: AbrB/MazE/SpoVT family DNA-binding domain-containing protein [Vulcanimicrobiaceae bacterium]
MTRLKLTRIGNSIGAIFPKDVLTRMNVDVGDVVYLTDSPDGVRVTPYNPDFERQMTVAENVMKKRRAALRELAK